MNMSIGKCNLFDCFFIMSMIYLKKGCEKMKLGERIKAARKDVKMTQAELAQKIGLATGTIQQYELGKREPRIEIIQKLCTALDVSFSTLMKDADFKEVTEPDRVALRQAFGNKNKEWEIMSEKMSHLSNDHKKMVYTLIDEFYQSDVGELYKAGGSDGKTPGE